MRYRYDCPCISDWLVYCLIVALKKSGASTIIGCNNFFNWIHPIQDSNANKVQRVAGVNELENRIIIAERKQW